MKFCPNSMRHELEAVDNYVPAGLHVQQDTHCG